MKKQLNMISQFAKKYSIYHASYPTTSISKKDKQTRKLLIHKMSKELIQIINNGNLEELAIALANVQFVLLGTVCVFGMKSYFENIFYEVWKSNMTRGIIKDKYGKLIKGKDFKEPQISFTP